LFHVVFQFYFSCATGLLEPERIGL